MSEPLQQHEEKIDTTPPSDGQRSAALAAALQQTATDIRASLEGNSIEVLPSTAIREERLRPLREQNYKRPEVLALSKSDRDILAGRTDGDLNEARIEAAAAVCELFFHEAEEECKKPDIDLPKARVLLHHAYSYAKSLSAPESKYKDPRAMNALQAWQTDLAARNPAAVGRLVQTYVQSVLAEAAEEKPDHIWMGQWIALCTGFAPALTEQLAQTLQAAITKRCEYFVAKVEAELAKPRPDRSIISMNIIVPPKYYDQLPPGSTIPNRVKELEERIAAL